MKKEKLFSIIFIIVGIGMLIGFYFMYTGKVEFVQNSITTEGTVVDIIRKSSTDSDGNHSYSYYPKIEYTDKETGTSTFVSSSGSNPASYRTGDKVEIRYVPGSSGKAEINKFFSLWIGPIILGFFGLIFIVVGIGILRSHAKKNKLKTELLQRGKVVEAKVTGVERNTNKSINGRHPYKIIAQYSQNNEIFVFQSFDIWFDPTDFLEESIKVYLDPNDFSRYYMDTSFLPKKRKT